MSQLTTPLTFPFARRPSSRNTSVAEDLGFPNPHSEKQVETRVSDRFGYDPLSPCLAMINVPCDGSLRCITWWYGFWFK